MAKLVKQIYYGKGGEKKLNGFICNISKSVAFQAGFTGNEQVVVYAKDGKIIIEKA